MRLAPVLLLLAPAPASLAGTYSFALSRTLLADVLFPADHAIVVGQLDATRGYDAFDPATEGATIVASSPGVHTTGSNRHLELVAPAGATFDVPSLVLTYRGCAADAGGWTVRHSIYGSGQWVAGPAHAMVAHACVTIAAESPTATPPVAPSIVSFELGATLHGSTQASGTSLTIHAAAGRIVDLAAPDVTASIGAAPPGSADRSIVWAIADGAAGPRRVTVRLTGPGVDTTTTAWTGTLDTGCLVGQYLPRCATTTAGSLAIALPSTTGLYTATVTGEDGAGNVATAVATTAAVFAPHLAAAPVLAGPTKAGVALEVVPGTWTNEPATVSYSFWRREGLVSTLVAGPGPNRTYVAQPADVGSVIVGRETVANAAGTVSADTPPSALVLPAAPSGGRPTIAGLPAAVDHDLTALPGTWTNGGAAGQPTAVAYRWRSCAGSDCADRGTGAVYAPTTGDLGRTLEVEVEVQNEGGRATAASDRTAAVRPGQPSLLSAPRITGTPRVGDAVAIADGQWAGHGATPTLLIEWLACTDETLRHCPVVGTGETHTPVDAEVGTRLRVRSTATSTAGSAAALSEAAAPVLARGECIAVAPGSIAVCVGDARLTLTGRVTRGHRTSGARVRVDGRITIAGPLALPGAVTVRFRPTGAGPAFAASAVVPVGADGVWLADLHPRVNGRFEVVLAVAGRREAVVLDAGAVRVRPRITARFTARADLYGRLRDLRAAGRVTPGLRLPDLRLLIEARLGSGRIVGLICRLGEQPIVTGGRFHGACASRGLPADVRYRLVYAPGPGSPLERSATGWLRAVLRH